MILPYPVSGDIETATLVKRALMMLDGLIDSTPLVKEFTSVTLQAVTSSIPSLIYIDGDDFDNSI